MSRRRPNATGTNTVNPASRSNLPVIGRSVRADRQHAAVEGSARVAHQLAECVADLLSDHKPDRRVSCLG